MKNRSRLHAAWLTTAMATLLGWMALTCQAEEPAGTGGVKQFMAMGCMLTFPPPCQDFNTKDKARYYDDMMASLTRIAKARTEKAETRASRIVIQTTRPSGTSLIYVVALGLDSKATLSALHDVLDTFMDQQQQEAAAHKASGLEVLTHELVRAEETWSAKLAAQADESSLRAAQMRFQDAIEHLNAYDPALEISRCPIVLSRGAEAMPRPAP